VSEDPTEFEGGDINLYAHVGNSPQNFTDPYGLEAPLPVPSFPGPGGQNCVSVGFGARCGPSSNNKSNPLPPKPPEPAPRSVELPHPCTLCPPPAPRGCTAGVLGICLPDGQGVSRAPDSQPGEVVDRSAGEILKNIIRSIFGRGRGDPDA
jgi:hypothetical protein